MVRYDKKYGSIPGAVQRSAFDYRGDVAVDDEGLVWTFEDLEQRMFDVAKGLIAAGIQPGDRIALLGPNSAQWIQAAIGIHAAGGILVPLNTRFKVPELSHILSTSGARAVLTVGHFLGTDYVKLLRAASPEHGLELLVTIDDTVADGASTLSDFVASGSSIADDVVQTRIDALGPDDYSDVMFTSGTTGAPKGVKIKHSQSLRAYGFLTEVFTFRRGDSFAIVPPFFHTFGYKAGWLADIIHGVKTIPMRTFDSIKLLKVIDRHRVSVLLGPPTMFIDLINHPQRGDFDLSSLRMGVPSAAKVPVKLIEDMRNVLGFDIVLNAYGLTEASSFVTTCHPEDDTTLIASTVGRPGEGIEVVVVDDDENPVAPGEPGELFVRGYNVMDGYWEDPEETAKVLTSDGFLRTGDIGTMDENGFVRITDRKKDMFITGGFNAYPAEIEELLGRFEKLLYVAVIGMPDERLGEVGWAFVVPKPGAQVTESDVAQFARANMANFKVPRRIVILDDLPRNASLKVLKVQLREQARRLVEVDA